MREAAATLVKEIQAQGDKGFSEIAQPLFDAHPNLVGFRWTQYTPYFNDGDTCYFSAHTDSAEVLLKKDGDEDNDELGDDDEDWVEESGPEADAVTAFLDSIGEESLKALFDDHVQVTVLRDKVTVSDYEHD